MRTFPIFTLLLCSLCTLICSIHIRHKNILAPLVKRTDEEFYKKIARTTGENVNLTQQLHRKSNAIAALISLFNNIFNKDNKGSKDERKKILILMSDTGGGHRASAQAIDQAIQKQFPRKIDVKILDIWTDHSCYPYNKVVPVYQYLAKHPYLWRAMFFYGNFPLTRKLQEIDSKRKCYKSFQNVLENMDPDLVLSVHPLCHYLPLQIIEKMNRKRASQQKPRIPFITVVTDLGSAHKTWFDKRVDACYVPSEVVRDLAKKQGIVEDRILLRGLPVRPAFWRENIAPKGVLRGKLGLRPQSKTVLLMGGGDGVGGLQQIAEAIKDRLTSFPTEIKAVGSKKTVNSSQLVVICGKNEKVARTLSDRLQSTNTFNAVVKGFVNNIDEYMAASDCLVTKAGPGTIAEAMTRGLPLILSSYLPGQEYGNIPFVVNGGFGVYTGNRPKEIANTVSRWFQDEDKLQQMSVRAKSLARPEATIQIARDVAEVLLHRNELSKLK